MPRKKKTAEEPEVLMGNQEPTQYRFIQYEKTAGPEAIKLYNKTGRTAQEWQSLLMYDILAFNEEGLWIHTKYGYSVPRRNGKNEIVAIRELYGIERGEHVLHTAHRTTTSHSASVRLVSLLNDLGYTEVQREKKGEAYSKHYTYSKQFGLERIKILNGMGGQIDFRTRSGKGGLGEGFDLLIIDEAQEYTDDQESALKYVVSDSQNPQTIFCGTPPTAVSSGTVFPNFRDAVLMGDVDNAGWAEWSIDQQADPKEKEYWYRCNPSLGTILSERKIMDEIGPDVIDFNIQRLGLWLKYNQKSAISENEWKNLAVETVPKRSSKKVVGIKYGADGTNVALAIAFKDKTGKVFTEVVNCCPIRAGNQWIIDFLKRAKDVQTVIVDGKGQQELLATDMKETGLKKPLLPTVKEVVVANAAFEQAVYNEGLMHRGQPSLAQVVSNCDKRTLGSGGGFGYKSLKPDVDIVLMDSVILAHWGAVELKETKKQRISY